jgi:hypothetical protein
MAAAGPLPQVDQPATLTAKRKVLLTSEHQRAARRTTERTNFMLCHSWIEFETYKCAIVILKLNLTAGGVRRGEEQKVKPAVKGTE